MRRALVLFVAAAAACGPIEYVNQVTRTAATSVDGLAFCCTGCAVVYRAIRSAGLDAYYQVRDQALPARVTDRAYDELDDDAFRRLHVRDRADGARAVTLYLEDLRCAGCVWLVESTPSIVPGVVDVRVDVGRGRCDLVYRADAVPLSTGLATYRYGGPDLPPPRGPMPAPDDFSREPEKPLFAFLNQLGIRTTTMRAIMGLTGKRTALVSDLPGLTRDRREGEAVIAGNAITLIDTAGLEEAAAGSIAARMRAQSEAAIAKAEGRV